MTEPRRVEVKGWWERGGVMCYGNPIELLKKLIDGRTRLLRVPSAQRQGEARLRQCPVTKPMSVIPFGQAGHREQDH
jgi:hypothetical protein